MKKTILSQHKTTSQVLACEVVFVTSHCYSLLVTPFNLKGLHRYIPLNTKERKCKRVYSHFMTKQIINKGIKDTEYGQYERFAIETHFVQLEESYLDVVNTYVSQHYKEGDIIAVSEKIIAISQNRVIKKSDVKLGWWAKFLSKFVMKTTAGFSVGNVYKMQVAIDIAGLPRVLFAAGCSAVTKLFGVKGVFYKVVGHEVNGLDGFYGGAFKEYEELGILNPLNPNGVCNNIKRKLNIPAIIVDANDLGCNLLGSSSDLSITEEEVQQILKDNPAGQKNQCTPIILIRKIV